MVQSERFVGYPEESLSRSPLFEVHGDRIDVRRSGSVSSRDSARRAEEAVESYCVFVERLAGRGPYRQAQFYAFAEAVRRYLASIEGSPLVHRSVVRVVNGLREYLAIEWKRVPGTILYEADRLETEFFSGYDPYFEGDEPPGL